MALMLLRVLLVGVVVAAAEARGMEVHIELQMERRAARGGEVRLRCVHDVPPHLLDKVVFLRQGTRIFQYARDQNPPYRNYTTPGAVINVALATENSIVLQNLDFDASGGYSCEVSQVNPVYTKASSEKLLTVFHVPVTWWSNNHAVLPCVAPLAERLATRRPPPPLDDDRPRPRGGVLWRKGDEDVSSKRISPSGSLEVSRRGRKEGEGVYQCLVRSHGGLVMGYPTLLKFASMEKQFFEHPKNTTARISQPVLMSCNISSEPPATFSWLKDDLPLPDDDRHHVLQNQLLITDVMTDDEGSYRCIATNPHLNKTRKTVASHAGFLSVQIGASDQDIAFLPLHHETNITAAMGSRVVLPCPVTGWPRPKLLWELTPPDGRTSELEFEDQVFVIRSMEADQEGVYTCGVEGNSELVKTFSVTLTEPARITIPPTSREVLRASTVRFNCSAEGRPQPNISWYKDGEALQFGGRINLRKSTDGLRTELVISGVATDDAGIYQCFAQNSVAVDSYWVTLNVTGANAAAPNNVRCLAVGDRKVKVSWEPAVGEVVAYTVHWTPEEDKLGTLPGPPLTDTEETITVEKPLVPYIFQVRAYSRIVRSTTTASDLSTPVICQGQGVPISMAKLEDDQVIVSWKNFAKENPGVVQWILETMTGHGGEERNITLDGSVYNYTLHAPPTSPILVRVLGSRTLNWLRQDLSLVPWSSTANAAENLDSGDVTALCDKLRVSELSAREFTVEWRCSETDDRFTYLVCIKSKEMIQQTCMERKEMSATFEGLLPGTAYKVIVQARTPNRVLGGPFGHAYTVVTPSDSPTRFKGLSASYINSSMILVSWNAPPAHYKVHYSAQLRLPVDRWSSVETNSSSVLIPVLDPTQRTYLMVTGYDPIEHSRVENVPPYVDVQDLHYARTASGLKVWWSGDEPRVVLYAQNITAPLEQWTNVTVASTSVELPVDLSLPTYVMVTRSRMDRGQMLTVDAQKTQEDNSSLYLGLGIGLGVLILIVMALAAVCFWRRRKRALSPVRSRRRNAESNEENVEEAEMKAVGGATERGRGRGRALTNGGVALGRGGAGEPLLNGHVHITENPTSKTPNGKMKKGRYEAAFDVSRHEDPETTLETTLGTDLDADTSAASHTLLDTSHPLLDTSHPLLDTSHPLLDTSHPLLDTSHPLLDTSRPPEYHPLSSNNSFPKLPDDNMNSELARNSLLDNSKLQPTLQPNG